MRGAHALLLPALHKTHTRSLGGANLKYLLTTSSNSFALSYQPRGQILKLLYSSSTLGFNSSQRFLHAAVLSARGWRDFVCSPHTKEVPIIPNNRTHIFVDKTLLSHSFLCLKALLKSHQPKGFFFAQEVSMLGLGRRDVLTSRTKRQKALMCDPRTRVTKLCPRLTPTPHPRPRSTLQNVLRAVAARRDRTPDMGSAHKVKHNVLATAEMRRAKCKEFSTQKAAWGYPIGKGSTGTEVPRQPLCPGVSPQPCPPWAPGAGGSTQRAGGERPTGPPAPALQHAGPRRKGSRTPRSIPAPPHP